MKKFIELMNTKTAFWIRLAVMVVVGILTPLLYLIIKYNLFGKSIKITIGLWGLIAIIFIALALVVLIKFYVSGLKTKFSYGKQLIDGICKLILPITIFVIAMIVLKDYTNQLIDFCWVLLPCEIVAVIVNPLPKWAFDNNVDGMGEIADKVFKRNSTQEQGGKE